MGEGKKGRGKGWRFNPIGPNFCLKFGKSGLKCGHFSSRVRLRIGEGLFVEIYPVKSID